MVAAVEFPIDAADALLGSEPGQVLVLAEQTLAVDPANLQALQYRALAELGLEQMEPFFETVERAILAEKASSGDSAASLSLKALGLVHFDRYPEARLCVEEAIDQSPGLVPAWDLLGQALIGEGEFAEALVAAEQALALKPEDPSATMTLARATYLTLDYSRALGILERLTAIRPDDSVAAGLQASTLLKLERIDEAIVVADRAYSLDATSRIALRVRAAALMMKADVDRAEVALREWIAVEPEAADAWGGLGVALSQKGQEEEALRALREAVRIEPTDADYRVWLAAVLVDLGENGEALSLFTEVCEEDDGNREAWLGRCAAERALGLFEQAVASARRLLAVDSFTDSAGWMELGRAYSAAGRHPNAWRAFTEAARLDSRSAEAAVAVAVESILCEQEPRALVELREAEERTGASGHIEYNRGVAYCKLGKEGEARDALRRADKLDPELGAAKLVQGEAAQAELGGWMEHWFSTGGFWRKVGGVALLLALLFFLFVPILDADLLPGLTTGELTIEAYVPALLLGFLIVLPAVRGLAVGPVTMDVAPKVQETSGVSLDPERMLPLLSPGPGLARSS